MKKYIVTLIMTGLCSAVVQASTIAPAADAWVLSTHGDSNFGTHAELRVGYSVTSTRVNRSFMKFDLSGIESGLTITYAKLHVYCASGGLLDLGLYEVADDTWTETGLTWNNQPGYGSLAASEAPPISGATWHEIDVTASVSSTFANASDDLWSVVLKSIAEETTHTVASFRSRDAAGFEPYLTIISPIATDPTPADGATHVDLATSLGWTAGVGALSHNVNMGTAPETMTRVATGLTEATYTPAAPLVFGQTYYWQVEEVGASETIIGPVWSFTIFSGHYIASQYWTWHAAGSNAPHWSNYTYFGEPALGHYSSHDPIVAASHISQMLGNGINVLSVGYVNKAGDGALWNGLDADQAFQDGVMQAENFNDIKFAISYDLATRADMVNYWENDNPWDPYREVVPGVQFTDHSSTYPSFDFNLQDPGNGKYIYDELMSWDFKHFAETYFNQPNYLRINGQCVVFLYDSWRYNNGGVGGPADGFALAFNRIRQEMYDQYGYKIYLVGDFMNYYTELMGYQDYYRDYGFYQHYDAVGSFNIFDHTYKAVLGDLTSLATYTAVSQNAHNAFRPAVLQATRGYRQWLSEPAKSAYGSASTLVDFIPFFSYSFRSGDGSFGFWSSVDGSGEVVGEAQMVEAQRQLSPLAEADADIVYNAAFNQWGEGQIMEPTVSGTPKYPGFYEWTYLGVTKGILGPGWCSTIIGWSFTNDMIRLVVDASDPGDRYCPEATTNLASGPWVSVAHSDDGVNPFLVANLDYSTSDATGSNKVIYVNATNNAAEFFRIIGE